MQRSVYKSSFVIALYVPILLLTAGCGGEPAICKVTGTVKSAGQPVVGIIVNFVPAEGRPSWGLTDANGTFKLHYTRDQEGAVRGPHKVYFTYKPISPDKEGLPPPAALKPLIDKYGNKDKTSLTYEVVKDGQVIDIHID